jgi:hypothetical protein
LVWPNRSVFTGFYRFTGGKPLPVGGGFYLPTGFVNLARESDPACAGKKFSTDPRLRLPPSQSQLAVNQGFVRFYRIGGSERFLTGLLL